MIQIRKMVQVSKDDLDWFKRTYGDEANLSWALGELFSKFRAAHVHTPSEYAQIAATIVHDEINSTENL